MRIAVKRDQTIVTADGRIGGHDAGATLVRRFLRIFPDVQIIGDEPRQCKGFDVVPLEFLDPEETLIINMDVLDSPTVWNTVYTASGGVPPKIMNFVWWPLETTANRVQSSTIALSCGLFPTFANSERTALEVRELVNRLTVESIAMYSKLDWVNLGFRLDHVQERKQTDIPIVLYPAIYTTPVKRPDLFMEIVERVHQRTPIAVEMRLEESSLDSKKAKKIARLDWVWVGPLTPTRSSYWEALSHTTAFLATASQESYGLSYVEALGAGVIGVLPDEDWARALVPDDYPYFYGDKSTAEALLYRAVTEPEACMRELDQLVDGSFVEWIQDNHSDDTFDQELQDSIRTWFGDEADEEEQTN